MSNITLFIAAISIPALFAWIAEHWDKIALIVSELMALFAVKNTGILKVIWRVLVAIFSKK